MCDTGTPQIFSTTWDYITHTFGNDWTLHEGIAEVEFTDEQMLEIANRMLKWHNEYDEHGNILCNFSGFIEREDVDFWEVAVDVLESNQPVQQN